MATAKEVLGSKDNHKKFKTTTQLYRLYPELCDILIDKGWDSYTYPDLRISIMQSQVSPTGIRAQVVDQGWQKLELSAGYKTGEHVYAENSFRVRVEEGMSGRGVKMPVAAMVAWLDAALAATIPPEQITWPERVEK